MPKGIDLKRELKSIESMKKSLPELKERAAAKANVKAELDTFEQGLPEIERKFVDVESTSDDLKQQCDQKNKTFVKLQSLLEPFYARWYHGILKSWKVSQTFFIIRAILVVTIFAIIIETILIQTVYRHNILNNNLQLLTFECSFTLIFIIWWIRSPKFRQLTGSTLVAMALFIGAIFVSDGSLRWSFISLGVTLVALGLSMHSFGSSEVVEKKLLEIDQNVKELLNISTRNPVEAKKEDAK